MNTKMDFEYDDGLYGMCDEDMDRTVVLNLVWTCDNLSHARIA